MKAQRMSLPSLLFAAVFVFVGVFLLASAISGLLKATKASAWPTVPAVLQSVDLKQESDSDGTVYQAAVSYSYRVSGSTYTGTTVSFGYMATSGKEAHQEIFKKLKSAKIVEARYNPGDPGESCLAYGISRSHQIHMAFAVTWVLFVFGFFATTFLFGQSDSRLLNRIVVVEKAG